MILAACVPAPEISEKIRFTEFSGPVACSRINQEYDVYRKLQTELKIGLKPIDLFASAKQLGNVLKPIDIANHDGEEISCGFWFLTDRSQYYRSGWPLPFGRGPFKSSFIKEAWIFLSRDDDKYALDRLCIGIDRLTAAYHPADERAGVIPSKIPPLEGHRRRLPTCVTADGEPDGHL